MANSTLFLAGDPEAQKLCKKGVDIRSFLMRHFLYSVLISSTVNMPAGCYYPSKHTQSLLHTYGDLYLPYKDRPPLCELSIGDDRESFEDDTKIKRSWFPEEYGYTDDEEISQLTKRISNIQPSIRSGKMRTRLTSNISHDIAAESPTHQVLCQTLGSQQDAAEILKPLEKVIEVQEYAILPTYIQIELDRHGVSAKQGQKRWLDFILFKAYSQSCEEAYQSYCNNPLSIFYDSAFTSIYPYQLDYRDTNLFQQFINLFPFDDLKEIERLNSSDILSIKYSSEFQHYLGIYQTLVGTLKAELQVTILENGYGCELNGLFRDIGCREFEAYKKSLIDNTQEALTLYRILKNPFTRTKRYREWLSTRSELPIMYLQACLKSKKNGILQTYIREIFQTTKQKYYEWRRSQVKNSNVSLVFGHDNHIIQENNTQAAKGASFVGSTVTITQDEFQAIAADKLDAFKTSLYNNPDIDVNSRKAVLAVLEARYCATPEEYTAHLAEWKENKKTFSQKIREAISLAANVAGIASLIIKLLTL